MCLKLFLRHSGPFDCHLCSSSRISPKAFSGTTLAWLPCSCISILGISLHDYPVGSLWLSPRLGLLNARITCLLLVNLFWMSPCSSHFLCVRDWEDLTIFLISLLSSCLIDSLSGSWHVDWKSFSFRILKALLYCFLPFRVPEKSKVILIPDSLPRFFSFFLSLKTFKIFLFAEISQSSYFSKGLFLFISLGSW